MANTQVEKDKSAKKNLSTEEEYSLIQAQASGGESLIRNSTWPQDESYLTTAEVTRPSFGASNDSNQIFASHYALTTAYTRVTKKLADAERRNQVLQMQDNLRGGDSVKVRKMSGSASTQGLSNFSSAFDIEASVNQAWEAYNEKCKECQQLRDELAHVKQQNQSAEHFSRIQDLQEHVLRERAKQDDVTRILEKTKMEADHLGKKETLAREELEKEREYQQTLIQLAEKKHKEMEQKIEGLERSLASEKNQSSEILKREKDIQKLMEDEFRSKQDNHLAKVRTLEENVISLKEEVSVLLSMQSTSGSNMHANGPIDPMVNNIRSSDADNDPEAQALCSEMDALKIELNDLRTRAAEQTHILTALFQNPKIMNLHRSADQSQYNSTEYSSVPESPLPTLMEGDNLSIPVQCSEQSSIRRKKRNGQAARNSMLPQKMGNVINQSEDVRQVVGSSIPSIPPSDIYGASFSHNYPSSNSNTNAPEATIVLKPTEDFIRAISKETNMTRRPNKTPTRNESFEYNPLFPPPVDVSRVIHVPSSPKGPTLPNSNVENYGEHSSNANNNFNSVLSPNKMQANLHATTSLQYTQYSNGNIPTYTRPTVNGQTLFPQVQDPIYVDERNKMMSPSYPSNMGSSSNSNTTGMSASGGIAPVGPKNPFYQELGHGDRSNVQLDPRTQRDIEEEILMNLDKNIKPMNLTTSKNIMDMDLEALQQSRTLQQKTLIPTTGSCDTPGNRYFSSDEENNSGGFEQNMNNDGSTPHHPKEFVVPKVVHASTLGNLMQNKKAFLDSRTSIPSSQSQMRPSTRAKSEQSSSTSLTNSRHKRQDNRTNYNRPAPAHEYGGTSGTEIPKKTFDNAVRTCPICSQSFGIGTSEDSMSRHINQHFSDDENDVLSFD